jgi:hypothetical protein
LTPDAGSIASISSFGEDAYGELYICDLDDGEVFKIVPAGGPEFDCNANGKADACDLLDGSSSDVNGDAVPDDCQCIGDLDGDNVRDLTDFSLFAAAYGSQIGDANYDPNADIDGDGTVDLTDFTLFASFYGVPCP